MMANPILLRVIECFAKRQGISLDEALGFFYHSEVYKLVCDGVSDMHCMSDVYLADELEQEYAEKADSNLEPSDNADSESIVVDYNSERYQTKSCIAKTSVDKAFACEMVLP